MEKKTQIMSCQVPVELAERIERFSRVSGRQSKSQFVRAALELFCDVMERKCGEQLQVIDNQIEALDISGAYERLRQESLAAAGAC